MNEIIKACIINEFSGKIFHKKHVLIPPIKVKIKRVSDTGRHKVIDTECSSGSIKILANSSTEIPSDSAHITFEQKYTYVYGDDWIVE